MEEDIEDLKKEKIEELQEEQSGEDGKSQEELIKQQAAKYLTKDARERLGNIRAARPQLASQIEAQIAQLGKMGRIEKIDDDELKSILKKAQNQGNQSDIKFRR